MIVLYILLYLVLSLLGLAVLLLVLPVEVVGYHSYDGKRQRYRARAYILFRLASVSIKPIGKDIRYRVYLLKYKVYERIEHEGIKKEELPKEEEKEEEKPAKPKKPKTFKENKEIAFLIYGYVRKYKKHLWRLFRIRLLNWNFKAACGDYFNTGIAYGIYCSLGGFARGIYFKPVFNGNGKNGDNGQLLYEGSIKASLTLYLHSLWWLTLRLAFDEGYRRYFPYAKRNRVPFTKKRFDKSKLGTYYTPSYGPLSKEWKREAFKPGDYYTPIYHKREYYIEGRKRAREEERVK